MIDETNVRIEEMQEEIRRDNRRRNAFYDMLHATDRVLWRLEEMNRDGVKEIPHRLRDEIKRELGDIPESCRRPFRDSEAVQDTLDSVFDVQEALFRWRNPEWSLGDDDDLERAS
jgi:Mg2+ and Co2+ transporter CorA